MLVLYSLYGIFLGKAPQFHFRELINIRYFTKSIKLVIFLDLYHLPGMNIAKIYSINYIFLIT